MLEKVLFIDAHNLMHRNVYPSVAENPLDYSFTLWKRLTLNAIIEFVRVHQPNKVIIAMDAKRSWRKDIFEDYKSKRKLKRDKAIVDFKKFYPVSEEFWKDFKETFKCFIVLHVESCEADDIIAILTKDLHDTSELINISTDKDFHQLLQYKNYKQYDPLKKDFVSSLNPSKDLELKILQGDDGDDIPSVLPKRDIRIARKILENTMEDFLKDKENLEKYTRNKTLIDFSQIPIKIRNSIISSFKNYKTDKLERNAIKDFLIRQSMEESIEDIQRFTFSLKGLI